jgi:hypothetical protein
VSRRAVMLALLVLTLSLSATTGRRRVMLALLVLTLSLSLWLALQPQPADDVVGAAPLRPRPPAGGSDPASTPAPARSGAEARRTPWPDPTDSALAAWSPPPAPAAEPTQRAAPPRPQAPPFPYQWIGRLDDGEFVQVLLSGTHRSFGVRAGEVLDGKWRVDQITGQVMQVTWLPTGDRVDVAAR